MKRSKFLVLHFYSGPDSASATSSLAWGILATDFTPCKQRARRSIPQRAFVGSRLAPTCLIVSIKNKHTVQVFSRLFARKQIDFEGSLT